MSKAAEQQLEESVSLSVQSQRNSYFFGQSIRFGSGYDDYANSLPSIYDPRRQLMLHYIDSHPQNNLWQGAVGRITHKVAGTGAEIKGGRRAGWYQDVIMFNADEGGGIGQFVTKILKDYFKSDQGAVAEIIGRGDPDSPLDREAVVGVKALDPLRCYFTMDTEYPVWYRDSVGGKLHRMHRTRVHRFVDQPYTDPELRGTGLCSLSRAIGFIQQAVVEQTYVGQMMSNEMPPGIMLIKGNPVPGKWKEVWDKYEMARKRDGFTTYRPILIYLSSGEEITVEFIPFSSAPENFDHIASTELQARGIALGLDTDPQDILPLQSSGLGRNGEAKILDARNKEGGLTNLLKMFERFYNTKVLPDYLRFKWKYRDTEESKQRAEIAEKHLLIANSIVGLSSLSGGALSAKKLADVAIRYLSDNVESLQEIFTDEKGEIISLYDDDREETETNPALMVLTDVDADIAPADPATQLLTDDAQQAKDYEDTRLKFTNDFAAVLIDANNGDIASRRRAGTILRGILSREGRRAVLDGLEAGGVKTDTLEGDDQSRYSGWVSEQSGYVSGLTARIFGQGLSDKQIIATTEAWANKSLQGAYYIGLESADKNGMYKFTGSDGEESCDTCSRLKGQVHRMKEWTKRQLRPGVDTESFDCGGFNCSHYLSRTTDSARGRF